MVDSLLSMSVWDYCKVSTYPYLLCLCTMYLSLAVVIDKTPTTNIFEPITVGQLQEVVGGIPYNVKYTYSELQVGCPNVKHKLTAIKTCIYILRKSHTSIQEQPQVYTALLDLHLTLDNQLAIHCTYQPSRFPWIIQGLGVKSRHPGNIQGTFLLCLGAL